jgi:hypothetical protein
MLLFSFLVAPLELSSPRSARTSAALLTALGLLFALRVAGQAAITFLGVSGLPPLPYWYSGLIPYAVLLPLQLAILGLFAWLVRDLARGRNTGLCAQRPLAGLWLGRFAFAYIGLMALRWLLTVQVAGEPWYACAIPVVFHWVLASACLTLAHHLRRSEA